MEQADLIWHNGELVAWEDAKVHVLTHGLHYGTGVFEGERAYETPNGPGIFRHCSCPYGGTCSHVIAANSFITREKFKDDLLAGLVTVEHPNGEKR